VTYLTGAVTNRVAVLGVIYAIFHAIGNTTWPAAARVTKDGDGVAARISFEEAEDMVCRGGCDV
jgi:hypothetical protein